MLGIVRRVGVDAGVGLQLEARVLRLLNHVRLGHVAGFDLFFQRPAGGGPVFHHAQHAARFQGPEKALKGGLGGAGLGPVVHVAEGEHPVGAAGRCDIGVLGRPQMGDFHLVVERRAGLQLLLVALQSALIEIHATVGGKLCRVEGAVVAQPGRQNGGIPAAAPGPDFHHRHIRLDLKERQGLGGVAIDVAAAVRLAVGAFQNLFQWRGHGRAGQPQSGENKKR